MRIIILTLFILFPIVSTAQESYEYHTFNASNGIAMPYRSLTPELLDKDTSAQLPLVIFLHGAGERGNDNERQLTHGSQMFLNPLTQLKFPAFVLFPQCPEDKYWAFDTRPKSFDMQRLPLPEEPSSMIVAVKELIDTFIKDPNVNASRVYVIGISMGGMATYDLVSRYPEVFAAAVPICGITKPERLEDINNVDFWIFHGDADNVVPIEGSRAAFRALSDAQRKNSNFQINYVEFAGCGHDSWTPAFNTPELLTWLFDQQK